jgi:hypothetical protein
MMGRHKHISFEDFKTHYINAPDGYYPTDVYFDEDGDTGETLKAVMFDMVCPYRLGDGKVRFIRVPFDTEEELEAIKGYVDAIRDLWVKTMNKCRDRLVFTEAV